MKSRIYGYDRITKPEEIPTHTHYAAIVFTSSYGCSECGSLDTISYYAFADRNEMEQWVIKQETSQYGRERYQIIESIAKQTKLAASVTFE